MANKNYVWVVQEWVMEGSPSIISVCSEKAHAEEIFKEVLSNYIDIDDADEKEKVAWHNAVNDLLYSEDGVEVLVTKHEVE